MSDWEERTTPTGFRQVREIYDSGGKSGWLFQVYGFGGGPPGYETIASVYAIDGKRDVPIDMKGRILIEGRWRSSRQWNH